MIDSQRSFTPAGRTAFAYAVLAIAWITLSDRLVAAVASDANAVAALQAWKGFAFVGLTTGLLYVLVRRFTRELVRRDDHLAERERQYRELFASSPEPMWVFDSETLAFLAVNDAAVRHYGWSREEFRELTIADIRPPEDVERLRAYVAGVPIGASSAGIWRHKRKDGSTIEVEIRSHTLEFDGRPARFVLAHDVTAERDAARRIARTTALYSAASRTAQAMVRLRERAHTFAELCGIVVESGGLAGAEVLAWDGPNARARRVAAAGDVPSDSTAERATLLDLNAVRHGEVAVHLDLCSTARSCASPRRRAAALFPLREYGVVIGALAVYADDPAWFDVDVRALLEEMAVDFSFTLDGFRREAARVATEAALIESESRFRHLLHSVGDVAWSAALDGSRLLYVNAAVETIYGRPAHEFFDDPLLWMKVIHPGDVERVRALNDTLLSAGRVEAEHRIVRPDGSERWVFARSAVVHDNAGRPVRIGGLSTDITERKRAEQQLQLAAVVFEKSRESIMLTDEFARIVAVNPAFTSVTGYSEAEALGRNPRFLQSHRQSPEFYAEMWRALLEHGYWQGEMWDRSKSGEIYPQWMSLTAVRDSDGVVKNYIGVISDLTDRKQAEERIERLAWFDELTGLPNRAALRARAESALAQSPANIEGFALLHVGLDQFNSINQSLGHVLGDQVLRSAAQRLADIAPAGSMLARIDGDEFALWIECHEPARALSVADAMRKALREPLTVGGVALGITGCIGITCSPRDSVDLDTLMRYAAAALSRAKSSGRDACAFFQPSFNANVCERLELENGLRSALERGELRLEYQPQIALESGRLVGFEALMRWRRPERGDVPPSVFIPIAEQCGLIQSLGTWALGEACRQNRAWRDLGLPHVRVAVNLSATQLAHDGVVDIVRDALEQSGLEADGLELEITESMLVEDVEVVARRLRALTKLGLEIALDDFGTGYSNLSYLKRLPLHRLKIDRSFVTHAGDDAHDRAITRAIVAMGHALGLTLIAEGVETEQQAALLGELGCHEGQGYLFARPLAANDVPRWHEHHCSPPTSNPRAPLPMRRAPFWTVAAKTRPWSLREQAS